MRLQLLHTDTWMFITQSGITFEDFRDEPRKVNKEIRLFSCCCIKAKTLPSLNEKLSETDQI